MVQCQVNVVMFQETQNWQDDGIAEEMGWSWLKEEKEGKAALAVKKKYMNPLRHPRRSTKLVLTGSSACPGRLQLRPPFFPGVPGFWISFVLGFPV